MSVIGIIAEFNPLHTGHEYLINEAKKLGLVVAVLSGNFVQRGDTSIAEKRVRAEAALRCGVDLVLELPVCWSMSTAQNFALGGVSVLNSIGCDTLMFGSECGNIERLRSACTILDSAEYSKLLYGFLGSGITFAAARAAAAEECGLESGLLSQANNNLATEYMLAARTLESKMDFKTVKRLGAAHDGTEAADGFVSASLLRQKLLSGETGFARRFMSDKTADLFTNGNLSDISKIEAAILAVLRGKTSREFADLPDLSEGIENKLFSSIKLATSLEGLYNLIKVKRYTLARIRRLVLSAAIGIDNSFFLKQPPYIRVLGFNKSGAELLRDRISGSPVPVIMRAGEIKCLSPEAQGVFETECRATDLYALSLQDPLPCGQEYTAKLIKTEC